MSDCLAGFGSSWFDANARSCPGADGVHRVIAVLAQNLSRRKQDAAEVIVVRPVALVDDVMDGVIHLIGEQVYSCRAGPPGRAMSFCHLAACSQPVESRIICSPGTMAPHSRGRWTVRQKGSWTGVHDRHPDGKMAEGKVSRRARCSPSGGTGHILPAAQRRLDHAVVVGALRYLHIGAVVQCDTAVLQRCVAFAAACIDAHAADFAFVGSHECVLYEYCCRGTTVPADSTTVNGPARPPTEAPNGIAHQASRKESRGGLCGPGCYK